MFTAIVWIGKYGSWSKGGFDSETDAWRAAVEYATDPKGALAERQDIEIDVEGPKLAVA